MLNFREIKISYPKFKQNQKAKNLDYQILQLKVTERTWVDRIKETKPWKTPESLLLPPILWKPGNMTTRRGFFLMRNYLIEPLILTKTLNSTKISKPFKNYKKTELIVGKCSYESYKTPPQKGQSALIQEGMFGKTLEKIRETNEKNG